MQNMRNFGILEKLRNRRLDDLMKDFPTKRTIFSAHHFIFIDHLILIKKNISDNFEFLTEIDIKFAENEFNLL